MGEPPRQPDRYPVDRRWCGPPSVSGILGILAGIIILVYPISSAVTLAFVGGIWLVIRGVTQVNAGLELRSLGSQPVATTTPYDRPTSAV